MTEISVNQKDPNYNRDLAVYLAGELGWLVFPCGPDKKPATGHGFKDATRDLEKVRRWWGHNPGALIGIYCKGSGFFALDVDIKNDIDGGATLAELIRTAGAGAAVVCGPAQSTPSGGYHWLFKMPEGVKVPNVPGKLGVGLDLRSDGYICTGALPNGSGYTWLPQHGPETELVDAPGWLLNKIRSLTEKPAAKPQAAKLPAAPTEQTDPGAYFLNKALAEARPGNRNNTGWNLALQLRDSRISEIEARSIMCQFAAAQAADYTEAEALASLASAYNGSPREPATLPGAAGHHSNGHKPAAAALLEDQAAPADAGYLPLTTVKEALANQENGDADLLAQMYGGRILFDHSESRWYLWGGNCWQPDRTGKVYRLVGTGVAPQYLHAAAEAQKAGDDTLSKMLAARAAALRNRRRAENVLFGAARSPALAITGEEWDQDPWLLACENGVINLQNGTFRPGLPGDFIRTHSPTRWEDLQAAAPRFEKFMLEIFAGRVELVDFMRRLLGYGITGLTTEHILPILWGEEGRNGKGTLLETLGDRLGALATSTQADAIMEAKTGGDGPKPFVYALRGRRLVWASESNEGRRINAGLVKQLTGGDRLNVRTLHSQPVEFLPSHLLLLLTNHKPHIPADDQAIWDRVCLIPFEVRFVENPTGKNEMKRDKTLRDKLKAEAPGILAWLVRGCLEWQAVGLQEPAAVKGAKEAYREEEDLIGQFIAECCVIAPGAKVKGGELYQAYTAWAKESGINPMNNISFGRRISKVYTRTQSMGVWYLGLGLAQK